MAELRKIIHVDMDAFFAAVEQLDNVNLRGKPVIVGGSPEGRGVVAAASYEARAFGVHSAMSAHRAYQLCPQGVFVPPRFARYKEISEQVMAILKEYSDLVEPLSLDEAYLDVTNPKRGPALARELAAEIRRRIRSEVGLTASAGVAPNKFVAKIASDMRKPDGLTVIPPQAVEAILLPLPVSKLPGVGRVTAEKLAEIGIHSVADLRQHSLETLVKRFGKTGQWFYNIARGEDTRPVVPDRDRKSIGCEDTFSEDIANIDKLHKELKQLARRVSERMEKLKKNGRSLTLKVTYDDFTKTTRSRTLPRNIGDELEVYSLASDLLHQTEAGIKPVRLLGISVSGFSKDAEPQDAAIEVPRRALSGPYQLMLPFFAEGEGSP